MLPQPPDVGFLPGQASAVNAALLSGSDADGLTVLHVADTIGLRILQCDEGNHQIALGLGREHLVLRGNVLQQGRIVKADFIAALLKSDAEHLLAFHGVGTVVKINLDNIIGALAFLLQDFQSLVSVAGGDDAVAHLALDDERRGLVAHIAQGDEVTVA